MRIILVDPGRINIEDLRHISNSRLKGVPIIRFRRSYWGNVDYPPLQIIDSRVSKEITLEELKKLGDFSDSPTNP